MVDHYTGCDLEQTLRCIDQQTKIITTKTQQEGAKTRAFVGIVGFGIFLVLAIMTSGSGLALPVLLPFAVLTLIIGLVSYHDMGKTDSALSRLRGRSPLYRSGVDIS